MQINMETDAEVNLIKAYEPGTIRINEEIFNANVIVANDEIISRWNTPTVAALSMEDFQKMAALEPMIILLGTGESQHFPDPALLTPLIERQIGLETMTTRNACHTYNVLVHEGRRVVAALFV